MNTQIARAEEPPLDPQEKVVNAIMEQRSRSEPRAITPMEMLKVAVDQNADLEKIEKLMELQERWEKTEARKAYVAAMAAFKADPPTLIKNKGVSYGEGAKKTEYKHATLDQVAGLIGAALSRHGLSHAWKTEQGDGGMIRVTCTITHVLGHSESVWLQASPDQSGGKNNIQAVGSTVSYLERYTLLAITGLATKDQDDDGSSADLGENISAEQKEILIELIKETRTSTEKYLALVGVASFDELPARRFNEAKQVLDARKAQQVRK